jgi:hypothetical protein
MKVGVSGLRFVYQIDITDCYQVSVALQQDKLWFKKFMYVKSLHMDFESAKWKNDSKFSGSKYSTRL